MTVFSGSTEGYFIFAALVGLAFWIYLRETPKEGDEK
jgi:hypothetical protein